MRTLHIIALVLSIVGAINWGLVGLFGMDVIATLFGSQDAPGARILYSLIGLAGVVLIVTASQLEPRLARPRPTAPLAR